MKIRTPKKAISIIFLLSLCGYATWKELETLSIVSIILFLCVLYSTKTSMVFDLFFYLAKNAKQAKFGNVELSIGESLKEALLENISLNSNQEWVKAIVSELTATHLTILLTIDKAGKYHCKDYIKNTLRELRSKGLIEHNKETMRESSVVWLTEIGEIIIKEIIPNEASLKK